MTSEILEKVTPSFFDDSGSLLDTRWFLLTEILKENITELNEKVIQQF